MGVDDIRRAIEHLDLSAVGRALREQSAADPEDLLASVASVSRNAEIGGVPVCEASLDDWKHCVAASQAPTQRPALRSRALEWRNGMLYAVELPGEPHDALVSAIEAAVFAATGTGDRYLVSPASSFVLDEHGAPLQADAGFGPHAQVLGAAPPLPLKWDEYRTLKVEVGVDRDWLHLDRRADQWRRIPGVRYVLCVRIPRDLATCQFRLDTVVNGELQRPRMLVTTVSETPTVRFDSRRLLGLAPHALLPAEFAQPSVSIDMLKVAQQALEGSGVMIDQ